MTTTNTFDTADQAIEAAVHIAAKIAAVAVRNGATIAEAVTIGQRGIIEWLDDTTISASAMNGRAAMRAHQAAANR